VKKSRKKQTLGIHTNTTWKLIGFIAVVTGLKRERVNSLNKTRFTYKINLSPKIFHMEIVRLTKHELSEDCRREKESRRSFLKHHRIDPLTIGVVICEFVAWLKFLGVWAALENLVQLLKSLVLIPKFCNGLIGVSLTDSLPAPAIN
jgi:hypothetical protein